MAELDPAAAFHLLEVPTHPLGIEEVLRHVEGVLRHVEEVKCPNTSPKTIDTYMSKGA
jgi:hypothetical protein